MGFLSRTKVNAYASLSEIGVQLMYENTGRSKVLCISLLVVHVYIVVKDKPMTYYW